MKKEAKVFKNSDILPVYRELIEQGKEVSLTVEGYSMEPFLKGGRDRVILKKMYRPLKRGDIALYERQGGDCVLHRVWKVKNDKVYFVGDAQTYIEGPIDKTAVFAITETAFRKGKNIKKGDLFWWIFEKFWLFLRPLRQRILSVIQKIKYGSDEK